MDGNACDVLPENLYAILPQTLVTYSTEGNNVVVTARKAGLEFMFGGGTPINEPIIYGGPFVATTAEQMREMHDRYARGEMGVLEPYDPTNSASKPSAKADA